MSVVDIAVCVFIIAFTAFVGGVAAWIEKETKPGAVVLAAYIGRARKRSRHGTGGPINERVRSADGDAGKLSVLPLF